MGSFSPRLWRLGKTPIGGITQMESGRISQDIHGRDLGKGNYRNVNSMCTNPRNKKE